MRVLVTGGGTGGHIYPALAIAKGIREQHPAAEVLFVGTARGLEAEIIPREGFPFQTVTVEGLSRKISFQTLVTLLKTGRGCLQAFQILQRFRPAVVVGTGGYVCGPVVLAAALRKIPTLIHEQNVYPGLTNKLLARLVDRVAVTFPESQKYFAPGAALVVTGLPVRPEILQVSREQGRSALGLDRDKFTVLAAGGSRGARSLNRAMLEVVARVRTSRGLQLIYATGQAGYEQTINELKARGIDLVKCGNITIKPYLYNMAEALAASDLVVCRAGATTIAELTGRGLPSILIPYPYAADNHQEYNARALVRKGAARMILDRDLTGPGLWAAIRNLSKDRAGLAAMAENAGQLGKPEALTHLLQIINDLAGRQDSPPGKP